MGWGRGVQQQATKAVAVATVGALARPQLIAGVGGGEERRRVGALRADWGAGPEGGNLAVQTARVLFFA